VYLRTKFYVLGFAGSLIIMIETEIKKICVTFAQLPVFRSSIKIHHSRT